MIKLLVKWFIKNPDDVKDSKVREKYGVLGGVLGIICNLVLFAIKLVIGLMVNAIAVMSDAFNNLTDSFSSIVTIKTESDGLSSFFASLSRFSIKDNHLLCR